MKKEFGKWLLDVAKYVATAVILASFFKDAEDRIIYIGGIVVVAITLVCGLFLTSGKEFKLKDILSIFKPR